tara:strand:+ start:212 stop:481 length:270 start_codon:yes stop_codon:yes gene_type:complete
MTDAEMQTCIENTIQILRHTDDVDYGRMYKFAADRLEKFQGLANEMKALSDKKFSLDVKGQVKCNLLMNDVVLQLIELADLAKEQGAGT